MVQPDPLWEAVSPLLDVAFELSPIEREKWLATVRAQTPELAQHVEGLLEAHRALCEDRFLDTPSALQLPEPPLSRIVGPYTLITPIGEGGMGTVWLAERTDGEIQRKVAVKFLAAARRRAGLRERFLRERQLLSSLSHPAIVQVIDAGHTSEDEPYLVMEYVDGRHIDEYAATLSTPDRLRLFLEVCDGVAYAHRRLIIHRDLKPSNILVDQSGRPKLLDFGIAKLFDEAGDATVTQQRVLTPKYASPEQFRGAAQTTATDIYSLGAVLYTLMTGQAPRGGDGALAPAPESIGAVRLATSVNPVLPVDLNYVLGKALRVEPEERYASVDAFASDIRALLESRPVDARSGDRWYRTRKFLRRHRLQVAAAAAVMISLSVGLVVANRERVIAQRRFQQVRQFANEFIALDADLRTLQGATKVRSRVASEALAYLQQLGREARGDTELSFEIGNAYREVGEDLGVPVFANLGEYSEAQKTLAIGDAFIDTVRAASPRDRRAWLVSAEIQRDLMALADYQDRRNEAIAHAKEAAARIDRFVAFGKPSAEDVDTVTQLYMNIATAYSNNRQVEEQIAFCRRALAISDGVPSAEGRRAAAFGTLSVALLAEGDTEAAFAAAHTSRTLLEPRAASGSRGELFNLSLAYYREGATLGEPGRISLNRFDDAADAFERSLEIAEALTKRDASDSAARAHLAIVSNQLIDLFRDKDPARSVAVADHALQRVREGASNARLRFEEAGLLAHSSYAARELHHENEAKSRLDDALHILQKMKEYPAASIDPGGDVYDVIKALADDYADTGQNAAAVETYRTLLAGVIAAKADPAHLLPDAIVISDLWRGLARELQKAGQSDEAAALHAKRSELWAAWDRKLPNNATIGKQIVQLTGR
jgi:tetratricopeptide (TPR) repeat protein